MRSAESRIKLHITGTRCTQVYKNMYPNESLIEHVISPVSLNLSVETDIDIFKMHGDYVESGVEKLINNSSGQTPEPTLLFLRTAIVPAGSTSGSTIYIGIYILQKQDQDLAA